MRSPTSRRAQAPPAFLAMPSTAFLPPSPLALSVTSHPHTCPQRRPRLSRPQPVLTASSPTPFPLPPIPPPPPPPRLVIWGPPGSGKTSLCEALSHTHGLVHVSTGDLLRAHARYDTRAGIAAKPYLARGMPVPDDVVTPLVIARLGMDDCKRRGFVLDGFPRNAEQHAELAKAGFEFDVSFVLHAPRRVLERRIEGRRIDPETGLLYNVVERVPGELEVAERLVGLGKDKGRNISQHLALYGRLAADMFGGITSEAERVDADRGVEDVLREIVGILERRGIKGSGDGGVGVRGAGRIVSAAVQGAASAVEESLEGRSVSVGSVAAANAEFRQDKVEMAERAAAVLLEEEELMDEELGEEEDEAEEEGGRSPLASGAAPAAVGQKSPITLIRCDGYMCERESVDLSNIAFRGAATEQVMLVWNTPPKTVLLLVKKDAAELMDSVLEAARSLVETHGLRVIVEPRVQTELIANDLYPDSFTQPELLSSEVDFVVCLGGDGLILHVSTLFEGAVPPVLSFNLGSLGFLTPFDYKNFDEEVSLLVQGCTCLLSLRMRLTCTILREGTPSKEFEVLNEVVVDRGASPYLSNLDCFCDGKYITTVQADGVIMSTPTGSTAYNMSAGGSMVHPSVPAIMMTPICPHSLSFRPIVFPDAAKLRIDIAEDARSHAWASFDGKFRQQLKRGDGLVVQMSLFPVPTVNKTDDTGDWFQSLDRAFNFNSRAIQKGFSDDAGNMPTPISPPKAKASPGPSASSASVVSAAESESDAGAE